MFVHSAIDFARVKSLAAYGLSDYAIARSTGIPRSTVQRWRRRTVPPRGLVDSHRGEWRPRDERMYAYLLGLYLGDGNIWRTGRASWRLCLTLDARYPKVIAEARVAVSSQTSTPVRVNAKSGAVLILASSQMWPGAFPQHGPGQKHRRKIKLQPWQEGITRDYPKALLRGLIHSDGCRTTNRFETRLPSGRLAQYAYTRYFFTNHSDDIRRIFCRHCDLLGIRWTHPNPRNISISQRRSVARLDEFVGPKR